MRLVDFGYVTLQNFQTRLSRVFFTILGVAVAIAAVLSLVSFGYGLQDNLLSKITTRTSLLTLDITPPDNSIITLNSKTVGQFAKLPNVTSVSPQASYSGQITVNSLVSEINVNVVEPNIFGLQGVSPTKGRLLSNDAEHQLVANNILLQLLNIPAANAVGQKVDLTLIDDSIPSNPAQFDLGSFSIIGVVTGSSNSGEVYISPNSLPNDFTISSYQLAEVQVNASNNLNAVRSQIISQGFQVSSLSDLVDQANKIFNAIQISLSVFGVVALLVAAIGLVNTMTISLLERTNEIGIMRAVGATPGDILWLFLGESTIIGFLGGAFGILLGYLVSQLLNWLFNLLAHSLGGQTVNLFSYPVWFMFFIVALSTIVGFLGGLYPATQASRMNPLEALRYK